MNKENVKRFGNKHKKTIKKAVILVTVPTVVIVGYVVVTRIVKRNNDMVEVLKNGYIVRDEA